MYMNKEQMRSYSQQNDIMEQQNTRIADIYQRMLMGDKSSLSSLQSVKIPNKNYFQLVQNQSVQSPIKKKLQKNANNDYTYLNNVTFQQTPISPYKKTANRIQTIQQELFQQSIGPSTYQNNKQYQKNQQPPQNKQNFSSFIKNKVNQLRNQKELIKNQQKKELNQIKMIDKNIKLNINNQSKSYQLVKKKKKINPNQSIDNSRASPVKNKECTKRFQSVNIKQNLKKTQSSVQYGTNKHLPPLNQKRKAPTQSSQHNSQLNDSIYRQRSNIGTPINLANSKHEISPKATQKSVSNYKNAQVSIKDIKQKQREKLSLNNNNKKKTKQSRAIRVPLPELKKQRQQFAFINEKQKSYQLDLIQYHQQTKNVIQNLKNKYDLKFKNNQKMLEIKKLNNLQLVLGPSKTTKKNINQNQSSSQNGHQQKKKKQFDLMQQKIIQSRNDIEIIDQIISKKRLQIENLEQDLNKNRLMKYWFVHDLYKSDFQDHQQQNEDNQNQQSQFNDNHSTRSSNIKQAYSTSMPNTKDKGWKSKAIKQYDTNRSFQEYAKSRSLMKQSKLKEDNNMRGLNQIQQKQDQSRDQQEKESYKVTVDSRLRRLLVD